MAALLSNIKTGKAHNPQLNTIVMIQDAIKKHNGDYTVTQLWKNLDKKVMYPTYKKAIEYLIDSRKVVVKNKKLIWIFNPELIDKLLSNSEEA